MRERVLGWKPVLTYGVDFCSTDSLQGSERPTVIISPARSNSERKFGFLNDYRRLNVTTSRAQFSLIVIDDISTLASKECRLFHCFWNCWGWKVRFRCLNCSFQLSSETKNKFVALLIWDIALVWVSGLWAYDAHCTIIQWRLFLSTGATCRVRLSRLGVLILWIVLVAQFLRFK